MGTISHNNKSVETNKEQTLFDYADQLGVSIFSSCGRKGTCHECIVEIHSGMEALTDKSQSEKFLHSPYRLACQSSCNKEEATITFSPLQREPRILTSHSGFKPPQNNDSPIKRHGDYIHLNDKVIDKYQGQILGIAMDVGTTTVVMELIDLEKGTIIRTNSFGNPQRYAGSDIMNRISYEASEFQGELHNSIVKGINNAIISLLRGTGMKRRQIYEITVAGNSTMRDIVFNISVQTLGQRPYKSIVEQEYLSGKRTTTALRTSSKELGILINPSGQIYGLPLIGSHVGADTAAALSAMDMFNKSNFSMLMDVGTNTEIVAKLESTIIAASCPAGPAFEGGLVDYGMPAYEGAIEKLKWQDGKFSYKTINNRPPEGICGSGLIDLIAELRKYHLITEKGVFTHDKRAKEIAVVKEHGISFSRQDASNLAQAKSANFCGQLIVTREFGLSPEKIDNLYLAGGFANYINVNNAIAIGFLSPINETKVIKIGNASLLGARKILLSVSEREELERSVTNIKHIELETADDFFEGFVDGCRFEPMDFSKSKVKKL